MGSSAPSASLTVSLCSPLASQPGQTESSAVYSGCKFDFSSWMPPSKHRQSAMGGAPGGALATKQACQDGCFYGDVGIRPALDKTKGALLPANGGRHSTAVPPVTQGHLPSGMGAYRAFYTPTEAGPLSTCDRIMTLPKREPLGVSSQLSGELELKQVRVMEHHSPAPPLSAPY